LARRETVRLGDAKYGGRRTTKYGGRRTTKYEGRRTTKYGGEYRDVRGTKN